MKIQNSIPKKDIKKMQYTCVPYYSYGDKTVKRYDNLFHDEFIFSKQVTQNNSLLKLGQTSLLLHQVVYQSAKQITKKRIINFETRLCQHTKDS